MIRTDERPAQAPLIELPRSLMPCSWMERISAVNGTAAYAQTSLHASPPSWSPRRSKTSCMMVVAVALSRLLKNDDSVVPCRRSAALGKRKTGRRLGAPAVVGVRGRRRADLCPPYRSRRPLLFAVVRDTPSFNACCPVRALARSPDAVCSPPASPLHLSPLPQHRAHQRERLQCTDAVGASSAGVGVHLRRTGDVLLRDAVLRYESGRPRCAASRTGKLAARASLCMLPQRCTPREMPTWTPACPCLLRTRCLRQPHRRRRKLLLQ